MAITWGAVGTTGMDMVIITTTTAIRVLAEVGMTGLAEEEQIVRPAVVVEEIAVVEETVEGNNHLQQL